MAYNTKNFKVIKTKGFYRLKFTGKKLPSIDASKKKLLEIRDKFDLLYKFVIRREKICYVSTKGGLMCRHARVFLNPKNDQIEPYWKIFSKKDLRKGKKFLSDIKKFGKSKEYMKANEEEKKNFHINEFMTICTYGEFYECVKYIINRCKKIGIDTVIMPFLIDYGPGGEIAGHHNIILIKGKKAWRIEHLYGFKPQVNSYLKKQFHKLGIKFQGNLYHRGNQSMAYDPGLCQFWSLYFAFYYSLNKKVGFDDMFYTPGKNPHKEMTYQIRMFMTYLIELLKKNKIIIKTIKETRRHLKIYVYHFGVILKF